MRQITIALVALVIGAAPLHAATVTLDPNGFNFQFIAIGGAGQVTGPGISAQPIVVGSSPQNFTGLLPGSTYFADFFHNGDSDFSFTLDGSGNISAIGLGGGVHQMATGIGGTTLTLNTVTATYNANAVVGKSGQSGVYYINGTESVSAGFGRGQNSAPNTRLWMPGTYSADNLYNSGSGNEDFQFVVSDTGNIAPAPAYSTYAVSNGSSLDVRSTVAHFVIESDRALSFVGIPYILPLHNFTGSSPAPGVFEYEFDMVMTVGNMGHYLADFNGYTVTGSNALLPNGSPLQGTTGGGDFAFSPRLAYNPVLDRLNFQNVYSQWIAFATITGTQDGGLPLNMTITAFLPEPASAGACMLLAMCGLGWRRRSTAHR